MVGTTGTTGVVVGSLRFICDDPYEQARALSLYTKEPGTIAWLQETLRPGDVFYDIGANIGCYSLVAAQLVGPTGHVFAFEPHLFNACSLIRNIQANELADIITVVTTPLGQDSTIQAFHYTSLRPGSSGHQLGQPVNEQGAIFTPVVSVLTETMTLDGFEARLPNVVKVDVDGNERWILRGLAWWPPMLRSVQVEMHPGDSGAIADHLLGNGYQLSRRHYTQQGQQAIDAGADPARITDNAIFERVAVAA